MMPRSIRLLLAASAAGALIAGPGLVAVPAAAAPPPDGRAEGVIAGAWIVTLHDGESPDRVADDHRRNEGAQVDHLYRYALNGYAARMSDTAAARIARDSRVASVVADRVVEAVGKPGGGASTTQSVPSGIKRIGGDLSSVATSTAGVAVDVAVIDTGIDLGHPDLQVAGGKNCSTGSSYADGNGHGTHVAGTIGAKNNTTGVVGVVPGATLWSVRVLDNRGSGSWSSVVCGIDWVTGFREPHGEFTRPVIEVANMSLGGGGTEPAASGCVTSNSLHDAICRSVGAGVTYVVAAGNDAKDAAGFVPAAYDEVITVSALADSDGAPGGTWSPTACRADQEESLADFSNYGADVDLIAPGVCITSTWKGGGYNTISGTSMAAPHVAGAAALHKASNPLATPAQVQAFLAERGTLDWTRDTTKDPLGSRTLPREPLVNVSTF